MKTHLKWATAVLVVCMAVLLAPPLGRAEGTGRTITVEPKENLVEVIKTAQNGDTIVLNAGCNATLGNDMPWVIDKSVTFEGGDITLWVGGIILGANVTFRNTSLGFGGFVRNAIMANGHTLTLENVICKTSNRPLNLFCGGLYDRELGSTSCSAGTVIIKGKTSLEGSINTVTNEVGNIYAGNLCMGGMNENVSNVDGPNNVCQGNAKIIIEADSTSTLGGIYAGGAQQKIPLGAANGKVILTDPEKYKVDGRVDITLNGATVKQVYGRGAGETHVTYTDTGSGSEAKILVEDVSSFAVKSGYALLEAGSTFCGGAALSSLPGAKLSLVNLADLTVGSFVGGGKLILGEQQTLTVTGTVDGETEVQIEKAFFVPKEGFSYIQASQSTDSSFTLIPPSNRPDLRFVKNGDTWTVMGNQSSVDPIIVKEFSFELKNVVIPENSENKLSVDLTLLASFLDNGAPLHYLSSLPLEIRVNGVLAVFGEYEDDGGVSTHYVCETKYGNLSLQLTDDGNFEYLTVYPIAYTEGNYFAPLPNGTYIIELTIPGEHTQSGSPLSDTMTLTVGESGSIPDTGIIGGISPGDVTTNTVRIYLAAPGGPVKAGTVMAAVYDANGRLLSFGSVEIPTEGSTSVDVQVHLSGGREVRAFLTDDSKPLCQSQSVDLN